MIGFLTRWIVGPFQFAILYDSKNNIIKTCFPHPAGWKGGFKKRTNKETYTYLCYFTKVYLLKHLHTVQLPCLILGKSCMIWYTMNKWKLTAETQDIIWIWIILEKTKLRD